MLVTLLTSMKHLLLLVSLIMTTPLAGCAQQTQPHMADDHAVAPNTVRVKAKVMSVKKNTVTLKIDEVIAYGQGLIGTVSQGQTITVRSDASLNGIKKNNIIHADLREEIGIDASSASYVLINIKKND
jgi:hypothetical protein